MAWPLTPRLAHRGFPVTSYPATEKFTLLSVLYWKWLSGVSALKYFDMPLKKLSCSKKSHLKCSREINLYFEHKTCTFMIFPFLLKCWADTERITVCKDSHQVRGCLVKLLVRLRAELSEMVLKVFLGFSRLIIPMKNKTKKNLQSNLHLEMKQNKTWNSLKYSSGNKPNRSCTWPWRTERDGMSNGSVRIVDLRHYLGKSEPSCAKASFLHSLVITLSCIPKRKIPTYRWGWRSLSPVCFPCGVSVVLLFVLVGILFGLGCCLFVCQSYTC